MSNSLRERGFRDYHRLPEEYYRSRQYQLRRLDEEARLALNAMRREFTDKMNRILALRTLQRGGRPGAARPPITFQEYFNNPPEVTRILNCYLEIEEWKWRRREL
jgi:hypothetical protein